MFRQGSPTDGTSTDTDGDDHDVSATDPDMDPEFLAALPDDIRREVLDEHRRKRLAKTSSLQISARRKQQPQKPVQQGPIERLLKLPPRPPKPTFTGRKLTTLPELREAISEWSREFREEGPYKEDTNALCAYLHKVIVDERDMNKAVTAVKWLAWTVEEELVEEKDAKAEWADALNDVKTSVQKSVHERGLGMVKL
jgi:DNA repair protein REV1